MNTDVFDRTEIDVLPQIWSRAEVSLSGTLMPRDVPLGPVRCTAGRLVLAGVLLVQLDVAAGAALHAHHRPAHAALGPVRAVQRDADNVRLDGHTGGAAAKRGLQLLGAHLWDVEGRAGAVAETKKMLNA